ncbi:MAG TPA: hypothetical protein VGV87_00825 [Blastocatellia bacterium]|nr:hypothetical protein [Blastocatellia bacterium]
MRTLLNQDVMNCPGCNRTTPSGRAVCMYCGATLPVTRIEAAPHQRHLDHAELAFNTVIDPARSRVDAQSEVSLASALQLEPAEARAFIVSEKRVPIARSKTRQEAELIAALMRTCGLGAAVIADEDLQLGRDLIRARRIMRSPDHLDIYHSSGHVTVALAEIRLLVVGALHNTRVDFTEGISRARGNSGALLDTSEFRTGEMVVDVYAINLEQSFRIKADGFDYSGLVWPLSFRAEVNFHTAIAGLHGAAPQAKVDDDFARVRGLLARAWPERSRVEARGIKREGLSFRPVAQNSVIGDNRDQFDRYSRLMFLSQAGS